MNFKDCPLRNELKEGLMVYERETNLSPLSLIESLVERYLYDEGYLVTGAEYEDVDFPTKLNKVTNVYPTPWGKFRIRREINGIRYCYGTFDYETAEKIRNFLENKGWDIRYSNSHTKLKGKEQERFLLEEIRRDYENGHDNTRNY